MFLLTHFPTLDGMKTRALDSNIVVTLAAFVVNFCLLGVLRSNAVLYKAFVEVFEVNRQYAAWPSGIFGFFMCITGALSGFLCHHFSIRVLALIGAALASSSVSICSFATKMPLIIFLYGALQGVGIGLIVPLTHVILNQNISKYRACALGVAYSGSSVGSLVFPIITNLLLDEYDLRGTFLLLGGIMSNSLIGALLFRTPASLKKENASMDSELNRRNSSIKVNYLESEQCSKKLISFKEDVKSSTTDSQLAPIENNGKPHISAELNGKQPKTLRLATEVLLSPYFIVVSSAYAIYFSTSHIFLMVVLDFAKDRGVPSEEAVFLISAFSAGDFCGRLTFGWIADTQFVRRSILVRCYLLSMGLLTALLPLFPTKFLCPVSILLGIINGSIIVNHSVLLNEYLGIQKLPLAMGFSTCLVGITAFLRPIVIGVFRDHYQNYDYVFLFMGGLQIAMVLIWFLESIVQLQRRKNFVKRNCKPV